MAGVRQGAGLRDQLDLLTGGGETGEAHIAGGVEDEVGGVDFDPAHPPLTGELHGDGIVALGATTRVLPALAHVAGAAEGDDVVRAGVEHVRAVGDPTAVLHRGEVDGASQEAGVRHRLTVDAQAGDAAVGDHVETDVGEALLGGGTGGEDLEVVLVVALRVTRGHQGGPGALRQGGDLLGRQVLVAGQAVDGDLGGVVALEPGGVHDNALDLSGDAETHDGGVVPADLVVAATAGLPAVVDLALVAELVRVEAGLVGGDEVLALGEGLVGGPDHGAGEGTAGEVRPDGELGLFGGGGTHDVFLSSTGRPTRGAG